MGLAEALLRTPDTDTRDRLIAEKIAAADWASHLGQSDSLFVNASTWGLMLTGRLIDVSGLDDAPGTIRRLAARVGEPIIRAAVAQAVRIMGEQFVLGRTIEARYRARGERRFSLLLRHAGRRRAHRGRRRRYEAAYAEAITAIGKAAARPGRRARHFGEAVGAVAALRGDTGSAGLGRALSPPEAAGGDWRRRPTSTSPSTPRRPTAWSCR